MKRWMKSLACVLSALVLVMVMCGSFAVDAASDSITVTSAITDERLYSGNDLQEAFDAAERGSIVSIGRNYTLTEDVVLKVEVMISGQNYLKFSNYHIQLTGNGAIYVTERFSRSTYVTALNSYSEVDWIEEGGGFIYYLIAQAPSFEDRGPAITPAGDLLGAYVDAENAVIYLDAAASGLSTEDLAAAITIGTKNAETVQFRFTGNAGNNAANGMVMVAEATNYDYSGKAEMTYDVILLGDVNGNGLIDSADASLISFHVNGSRELTGAALLAADANRDGEITAADATLLCKKYVRPDRHVSPLM